MEKTDITVIYLENKFKLDNIKSKSNSEKRHCEYCINDERENKNNKKYYALVS